MAHSHPAPEAAPFTLVLTTLEAQHGGYNLDSTPMGQRVLELAGGVAAPASWLEYSGLARAEALTARELTMLQVASEGLTNTAIARRYMTSEPTVRNDLRHAREKLHCLNLVHAIRRGLELTILTPLRRHGRNAAGLEVDGFLSLSLGSRGWANVHMEQLAGRKASKSARTALLEGLGATNLESAVSISFGEQILQPDMDLFVALTERQQPGESTGD